MEIFLCWLLFAVGIVLVVKGGDIFVDAASSIAKELHIPTFVIGATIVSLATTLPELLVSVLAAVEGKTDMAVGNAVGSVTANTALILGIAMVSMPIICSRRKHLAQILLLIAAAVALLLSSLGGALSIPGSIVLLLIFIFFMVWNLRSAKRGDSTENSGAPANRKLLTRSIILFLIGAAAIVIGSRLMVRYGSDIAVWLGVPERIIALTLIAVGTSLPELVTTITAIIKKESALSVGNIIGANIIDLSLILPVCSLISGKPLPVAPQSAAVDLPACLLVTLLGMVPLLFRQKASKLQGIVLLAAYAAYLIIVIV